MWNPFDPSGDSDPTRSGWTHLRGPGSDHDITSQRREVFGAIAVPFFVLLAVVATFHGNKDLVAFWAAHRSWAPLLQALAVISVLVGLVLLGRIAVKRYASPVKADGIAPPLWFRTLLASLELDQVLAIFGLLLVQVLDLDQRSPDGVLICFAAAAVLTIGQHLIRWNAEAHGWETGRLLWGRND